MDEERRGLISSGSGLGGDVDDNFSNNGDAVIEMDLLPPRWADVSDEVNELLVDISRKSLKLDRLHSKHVLPGFDDNRSAEEGEIERLTGEITNGFHECQKKIRRIEGMIGGEGGSKGEETMGRNIQISLATKVQEASTSFRKKQSSYLKSTVPLVQISPPGGFDLAIPC